MQRIIPILACAALPLTVAIRSQAQQPAAAPAPPLAVVASHTLRTGVSEQPKIELLLRLPRQKNSAPGKAAGSLSPPPLTPGTRQAPAQGTVVYASWSDDPAALRKLLESGRHPLARWADDHQMAILTFDTATLWKSRTSTEQLSLNQRSKLDYRFDRIAAVWVRGTRVLCRRHHLPDDGFLAYGISRGSHYLHRLVVRHPDHFAAVHLHVPNTFEVAGKHADKICWLITTGHNDPGMEEANRYCRERWDAGWPILFRSFFGMGHGSDSRVDALRAAFFEHILATRAVANSRANAPGLVAGGNGSSVPERFRHSIEQAPWVADSMNGVVYPVAESRDIPEPQRVYLPTRDLASHWGRILE